VPSTSCLATSSRSLRALALPLLCQLLLLAACGRQDPCGHAAGLALDVKPGPAPASWVLFDPAAKAGAPPLDGEILAIAAGPEDGAVAAGLLRDASGTRLFAITLDRAACVVQAWTAPPAPAGAEIRRLVAMGDGGLLVAGRAPGPGAGNDEAWVARYDGQGQALWSVIEGEFLYVSGLFETPSREVVTALALLPDGQIAAAGTADVNAALYSNWVLLLDTAGRVLRRIDLPRDDPRTPGELAAVTQQADGSLLLAGTLTPDSDQADAWVLAVGADSTLLWDRRYRQPGRQRVLAAAGLDHGLALAGRESVGGAAGDAWLSLIDSEGEDRGAVNMRAGAAGEDGAALLALMGDQGNLLAAGGSGRDGGAWMLRLTPNGAPLDSRGLPGGGQFNGLLRLDDGRALAAGRLGAAGPPLVMLMAPPRRP
jgi:hypothetical protein